MIRVLMSATVALGLAFLVACSDDIQRAEPPTRPNSDGTGTRGSLPPGHPPMAAPKAPESGTPSTHGEAPGSSPFGEAEVEPATPAQDPTEVVYAGTVSLAEGVVVPDPCWLWVSVKAESGGRLPLLTRLYPNPTFPLAFEIRRSDTAFPGAEAPKEGSFVAYASVSKSRFVDGIVLRSAFTAPEPMGTRSITIEIQKP